MDKFSETKKTFESLGLTENKEYLIIGKNETGKKSIEGLIPDVIFTKIYSENVDLVRQSMENSEQGKDARSLFKTKVLEAFKEEEQNNNLSIFENFYPLVQKINKIFK